MAPNLLLYQLFYFFRTQRRPVGRSWLAASYFSKARLSTPPAGEPRQEVLAELSPMLGVMLYPGEGSSQPVLLYHLRCQVLGHVSDGGILILRHLRADHY